MRVGVLTTLASLVIVSWAHADDARASIRKPVSIAAQPLELALQAFAKGNDVQLIYKTEVVRERVSPGASGTLTVIETLLQLLSGTGLTYKNLDDHTITIVPFEQQPPTAVRSSLNGSADTRLPAGESEVETEPTRSFWGRFRLAQAESSSAPDASAATNDKLEEIVVSAQKKQERLQDVPVPVTAINATDLATNNQTRLQDYFSQVPGLTYASNAQGTPSLAIRGLSTGTDLINPTVAIVVDDVPSGASTQLGSGASAPDIDPNDLARVEVLRGPQGTLYGASSLGGLIKYVTVDPSTDGVTGRVLMGVNSVQHGDNEGYNLSGSINVPLNQSWAVRASGFTRQDPGYIDNPSVGERGVNEARTSGGRLAALWRSSDVFSLKLSALYQDSKVDGVSRAAPATDLEQSYPRGVGLLHRTYEIYSATATANLGRSTLTSISGYGISKLFNTDDFSAFGFLSDLTQDLLDIPNGTTAVAVDNHSKSSKLTQEIRLATPLGSKVDWLMGGFYTHEHNPWLQRLIANSLDTGATLGSYWNFDWIVKYDEYAAFTDFTFHVTDRFDLQVGGREARIEQFYTEVDSGPLQGPPLTVEPVNTSDNAFTYLVTPQLRLSQDLMIYARFASGYRPGGPNAVAAPNGVAASFEPDTTRNYELGVKGSLLDHRVSFDASAYYIDWKDIQIQFMSANQFQYNKNGGGARSQGMELSVDARPVPGLNISSWVAYNDAKLTEALPADSTVLGAKGDRLPNGSRFSGSFSLNKEFPLTAGLRGFAGGSVNYVGERKGNFVGTGFTRPIYPGYASTDLRLGVSRDAWTTSLFVNNVADRRGVLYALPGETTPIYLQYLQPRTIGLSLSLNF